MSVMEEINKLVENTYRDKMRIVTKVILGKAKVEQLLQELREMMVLTIRFKIDPETGREVIDASHPMDDPGFHSIRLCTGVGYVDVVPASSVEMQAVCE